jgi:hypothetical protein
MGTQQHIRDMQLFQLMLTEASKSFEMKWMEFPCIKYKEGLLQTDLPEEIQDLIVVYTWGSPIPEGWTSPSYHTMLADLRVQYCYTFPICTTSNRMLCVYSPHADVSFWGRSTLCRRHPDARPGMFRMLAGEVETMRSNLVVARPIPSIMMRTMMDNFEFLYPEDAEGRILPQRVQNSHHAFLLAQTALSEFGLRYEGTYLSVDLIHEKDGQLCDSKAMFQFPADHFFHILEQGLTVSDLVEGE